ncbi:phage minor head protein [Roseibacterium sp. SDUM158017]|uniref:phage minor head protein n=1 Tax=Roseicyclus salinarum TaxID=3036773 RepID=UPI0024156517|nr:phage minor head protein [Roseibacterium sp. SDUM158017]MDG4650105.1 phage minor head protein [Roseibacterium sp. SDUM158017]
MAPPDGGANEVIADLFTRHAVDLLRLEANERKAVRRILQGLERELVAQIARIDPTGPERESYRARRLDRLLDQVRDTIRASYRQASSVLRGELIELADIEGEFVARAINEGVRFDLATASFTREQLRALVDGVLVQGAPVSEWWQRQAGDTLQRFTDEMRSGIAQGQTNAQLMRRVRGGTENGEAVVGFMSITRRHADSLVRSATQAVAERAKQATYEANEDIIGAVVWTSTLDSRTTLQCMVRDGLRYRLKDKSPIGHKVPWLQGPGALHWGCRSTSRPETKSWRDLGIDADDLPPQTRASMNGEVAADTTFEGWLSRRSSEEQDEALGAGRAELWREGKITFRQLLDGNGRELSLEELRARVRN